MPTPQQDLFDAIARCDPDGVDTALLRGADPSLWDGLRPPLALAARLSDHAAGATIARRLLAAGADPNGFDGWRAPPIHHAARSGNVAIIRMLLAAGAEVGAQCSHGITAHHAAVHEGHSDALALLLAAGAGVDMPESVGAAVPKTVLAIAAGNRNPGCVAVALAAGADPSAPTPEIGETPIHAVLRRERSSLSENGRLCILALLRHGARLDERNANGTTAETLIEALASGHERLEILAAAEQARDGQRARRHRQPAC